MTESTTFSIAIPPEMPDLNPETISIPPLDPLFLSASDPISDLSFFLDEANGDFTDLDFPFDDSADFFDFNLDAEVPVVAISEESTEAIANKESPETKNVERGSEERSDSVHSQVSSQGSKTLSPGGCDTSSSPEKSSSVSKRKKGDSGGEYRSSKYQKSDASPVVEEDDEKKKVRLIRNRESAQLSRLRKKQYVEELQGKVKSMNSTIAELNSKISYVMAENAALRHQMMASAGGGGGGAPHTMNPYMAGPPLPYQWLPYPPPPPYPYGSQIPIPKLPLPRCGKPKKGEGKSKMKKVASVSFIGILFFMFLFGMLVPSMNNGGGDSGGGFGGLSKYDEGRRYYDEHRGKVLMVGDGSDVRRESVRSSRGHGERDSCGGLSNSSEPLFASLYVPRNDGLVKIDGNLIIHSVLASEKAKKNISETMKTKEPELMVPGALSSALAVPDVRGNGAMLPHTSKALSSSGSPDGKRLHQWFHEGGAGTLMDYSMCTEVFQFDISPGAIVPSSVSNITREHLQNVTTTRDKRMKNRRILEGLPVSRLASELNITESQASKDAQNKSFHGKANTKPTPSSMVVSVLLDPREVVDSETDRVMPSNTKSLSRIFVVVLLDSVKYVTYSCVLPRSGLHLVAT